MTLNRQWRIARRPVGPARESDFRWHEDPIPVPGPGELLVHNEYLSLDPTNRSWLWEEDTYLPALKLGDVVRGVAIGTVEQSNNPNFPVGTTVSGALGWQDYSLSDGKNNLLTALPPDPQVAPTMHFGLFGHIGVTAYFGLLEVARPKKGDTLVISAAAGAVGSLVGQIAKLQGCRVIGTAGSEEKCRWITQDLGFDLAINYKKESVYKTLKENCPNGIDIYFDNVGGAVLEDVLSLLALNARIVVCGMISLYNAVGGTLTFPPGPNNLFNLVVKRARMEGFLCLDYWDRRAEAYTALANWYRDGKIQYRLDIVEGLKNAPRAMNKLFDGTNHGKLVLKL
jgi:NADPH-dependent curcumin reductase